MSAASPQKARRAKGRHRKQVARNRQRAARNGILAAAVGVGLAVAAGQGVAAAAPESGSPDSASKGGAASDAGTPAKSTGATGTAGSARKRPSTKQSSPTPRAASGLSAPNLSITTSPNTTTPTTSTTFVETTAGALQTEMATPAAAKAAPAASAAPIAAETPAAGTGAWYFMGALSRAVNRLAGWPGLPHNFVTITNHLTDQSLDAIDNQLDALIAGAVAGSPARWIPDLSSILGLFVQPAIPTYSFTDTLNAWGDFLNRIVPPFTIAPGAGTFGIINQYKIMGAAVVGTATVLIDMLNGVYDPAQWEIDVIKATTGAVVTRADLTNSTSLDTKIAAAQAAATLTLGLSDGGAFYDPTRAWDVTLPTWTAAQVNPFTVVAYVALVAIYKRFQEMAVLTTFTTSTTYDSWLYTLSLGGDSSRSEYAAGTFHAVDPDGRSVDFGTSLLGTFTSAGGGLVTINTSDGGFTYTNTLPGKAFFHRATSENEADRYDTVNIPVTSADGVKYTLAFQIKIIDGSNSAPTVSGTSVGSADGLGVVRGTVNGSDSDGDALTYSLVGSSVNGLSGNSAYTKSGANNGGIVTLNSTTGAFTYVSSATAASSQSFQVQVSDGHGGSVVTTVTVPNKTTSITPANVNTATQYVVTGSVPIPSGDAGIFTTYALGTAPTKGSVTSFNPATGAFTYVRNSALGHTTTPNDVVTVLATDANGRTVTLRMDVVPTMPNVAPSVILTTQPTVGTLAGTTQTSTGKLTFSDSDGDAPIWTTVTSAKGATVTFAPDGTFTYTSNLTAAQRHAVAMIGAAGSTYNGVSLAAYEDAFTETISDGYGGTTTITVTVPIYSINANPTMSAGGATCAFATCTVGFINADDPDNDLDGYWTLPTSNNGAGSAWYTLTAGSMTIWGGAGVGTTTISWGGNTANLGTAVTVTNTLSIYDGYYRVTDGVVDPTYAARVWKTWSSSGTSAGN
jgi:hypothetical protein